MMICPYCNEKHEALRKNASAEYRGSEVEYYGTYYTCPKSGRSYADTSANDIALKDAYRKENGLLTSSMMAKIRTRYREDDLKAILGKEEQMVADFGGHYVQSKEYDIALRTLDQMLQMSMHQ